MTAVLILGGVLFFLLGVAWGLHIEVIRHRRREHSDWNNGFRAGLGHEYENYEGDELQ